MFLEVTPSLKSRVSVRGFNVSCLRKVSMRRLVSDCTLVKFLDVAISLKSRSSDTWPVPNYEAAYDDLINRWNDR